MNWKQTQFFPRPVPNMSFLILHNLVTAQFAILKHYSNRTEWHQNVHGHFITVKLCEIKIDQDIISSISVEGLYIFILDHIFSCVINSWQSFFNQPSWRYVHISLDAIGAVIISKVVIFAFICLQILFDKLKKKLYDHQFLDGLHKLLSHDPCLLSNHQIMYTM